MQSRFPWSVVLSLVLGVSLLQGCGPAINQNARTSFLNDADLVQMTDQMSAAIASDTRVAEIFRATGRPMAIVMMPVQNETNEIIPESEKWMYVHRVRSLLASKQTLRSQFMFVLNKRDYLKLQSEEGLAPTALGPEQDRINPEYALTGTFYAQTNASSQQRSDYYLCTYRLTRIDTTKPGAGEIIWEGKYETKKTVTRGFLD